MTSHLEEPARSAAAGGAGAAVAERDGAHGERAAELEVVSLARARDRAARSAARGVRRELRAREPGKGGGSGPSAARWSRPHANKRTRWRGSRRL